MPPFLFQKNSGGLCAKQNGAGTEEDKGLLTQAEDNDNTCAYFKYRKVNLLYQQMVFFQSVYITYLEACAFTPNILLTYQARLW